MIIIADESVDFAIIKALRQNGFDLISIAENSPGVDDIRVIENCKFPQGITNY